MKGFTKDGKFHPITDYKGVRKSRDQKEKTKGIRLQRDLKPLTQIALDTNAFVDRDPLAGHFDVGEARKFLVNRGHSVKEIDNYFISQGLLPHEGKEFLAKRERKARGFKPILDEDGDIDVDNEKNQQRLEEIIEEETARREEKLIENEDAYEELLNSGTDDVTAMGITVGAGTFLREHDPIAFRESLLDYADGTRPEIEQEVRDEIDEEDSLEGDRFLTLSILSPEQRFSQ